eukprot:gb/GFBE01068357.1/.p1 GENE.gb/GFBE01068357.1/~~gb/GFBE01068357.1/.p1  ORF type:complete len:769 (+),score=164.12 gb/GFBE01068357.1/:1-2307(+)
MDGLEQVTLKLAPECSSTLLLDECSPGEQVLNLGGDRGYTSERLIGRGSFGAALLVRDAHGEEKVMKAIDLLSLNTKQRESAPLEPQIMERLRHPYIVRYRESFLEKGMLAIVMDYAGAGDLLRQVEAARHQQTSLPEERVTRWFVQALLGVKYMHNLNVIHRDLKNENLFLESKDHLRIGDFGLAQVLRRPTEVSVEHQIVGTPYYLSPEICGRGMYSTASDMWALGCILFELLSLTVPFDATNLPSLMVKISGPALAPRVPSACSAELADLCASLMIKDRSARPAAGTALQQPVLRETVRDLLEEVTRLKKLDAKGAQVEHQATQKRYEEPPLISAARRLTGAPSGALPGPPLPEGCKAKASGAVPELHVVKLDVPVRSDSPVKPRQHRAPLEMTALPLPAVGTAAEVQTTRERAPPESARAGQGERPRSLSPDVAYKHQLLLSKSGAAAAGAPQQWLREQRRERSNSNLHVQQQLADSKVSQQARGENLQQIPRLQLAGIGKDENPVSELDILSAAALPPSAWTSARQRPAPVPLPGSVSYRAVANGIIRSKSSSALSSARVDSAQKLAGPDSQRRRAKVQPPLLRLDGIQEKPTSKARAPSAPRGFPLKGLERAKSAAALPGSRAEAISARVESARRGKSSERRDSSKERKQRKAPLRTALKAGLLLQNVGVAIGAAQEAPPTQRDAPPSQREQLRQRQAGQRQARPAQQVVQPLLMQGQQGKPVGNAMFRNPSAPAGLHSARCASKPRIHQLQRHGVAMPKDL